MKINTNETLSDLKLLIDISSVAPVDFTQFEQFHKMLIRIAYKATDVSIDYERKRVYMHVVAEDSFGEYLVKFDEFVPNTMVVNLVYKNLSNFLKSCILEETERFEQYYPLLISRFFRDKVDTESLGTLESA